MRIKNKFMVFFEEEGGGGYGGGGGFAETYGGVGGGEQQSGGESTGGGESSSSSQTTQSSGLDLDALSTKFGKVVADTLTQREQQQTQTKEQRPPTPEEIAEARRKLNFWEPKDDFLQRIGNPETAMQAYTELRDGLTNQLVTITQQLLARQEEAWNQRFQPVQQMLTQREEAERVSRFNTAYPVLAKPELQPLLRSVGAELASQGKFQNLSEEQAFAVLAAGVESVIKVTNPEFSVSKSTTNSSPGRKGNSIPSASHGSGGTGSPGSGQAPKSALVQALGSPKPR